MTNEEARNLISRNKSVFAYDAEMTEALDLAFKALEEIDDLRKSIDYYRRVWGILDKKEN